MFDIGWTELLVIACVAIVVVGPKDLPRMLRSLGQTIGKVRRMSREFQSTFNDALREAEREADIVDMKKQVEEAGNFNPLGDLKKSIEDDKADRQAKADAANKAATEPQPWMAKEKTPAEKAEAPAEDKAPAKAPAGTKTETNPPAKKAASAKTKTASTRTAAAKSRSSTAAADKTKVPAKARTSAKAKAPAKSAAKAKPAREDTKA